MVTKLWFLIFILIHLIQCNDVPTLNINALGGQLGFIGDYAGLSPFTSLNQFITPNASLVMSSNVDNNLIFESIANINGSIITYCQAADKKYILGGDFTTINGTMYNHIVQLDIDTRQLSPLQQGLDGPVRSLYCATNQIYVGGDFTAPVGSNSTQFGGGHVAIWNNNQWNPVPWKGLNGPVYSIIPVTSQNSILFAGRFDSTGDGQFFNQNTSQSINLSAAATISGGNSALSGNNSNPSSAVCSQAPWLLQDGVPGYWEAQFSGPVIPSTFRISNTHLANQATNEFNIIALGSNQYFELSYKDPVTNQMTTCSEKCTLSNDTSLPYQDFTVVSPMTTNGIRINIDSWFGLGGGLGGVEIFRSDNSLQPTISNNNTAACSNATPSSSATTAGGNWTEIYSFSTYQNYLISSFPATQLSTSIASVSYQPYIASQGIYDVYVTTPGCVGTSTCNQRTQVTLTINLTPGTTTTYFLDQNVSSDQRTLIYNGTVGTSATGFTPSIQMKVATNATAPSSGTVSIVADSIEFIRNSTASSLSSVLNYFPANGSFVALAGQLPPSSTVTTLQASGSTVYLGGDFAVNGSYSNIVSYDFSKSAFVPFASGGVNGHVSASVLVGSQLVVGGLFNNTATASQGGIKNVAVYDIQANTWNNMNGGVNDRVDYLYSADSNTVHISGPFTSTNTNQSTFNNAQWSFASHNWITPASFINGPVSNQINMDNNSTLYLGSIEAAQSFRANDIATLSSTSWQSSMTTMDPNATVKAAVFYNADTVILGGLFHLNNVQYHLAIYNGSAWSGLLDGVQGSINTLYVVQNQLFIGGQFNGSVGTSAVTSFAVYDLESKVFQDVQGITSNNQQPGQVNVIVPQPNGKSIYVGGNFSSAGLLNCNSVCVLASDTRQWSQLNQGISGNVKDMTVSNSGAVTVVGDLSVSNSKTGLAVLDNPNTASWRSVSVVGVSAVDSLLTDGADGTDAILSGKSSNGQVYLGSWNGKSDIKQIDTTKLGSSTDIQHISYVPINSSPSDARFPSNTNSMLMVVGSINIFNVGVCSAALFDGTTWFPYILTSSSSNGSSSSIRQAFTVTACCTLDQIHHYLSVPAVILISIAISLAIIFVLIGLSFIYLVFKRKNNANNNKYYSNDDGMKEWKPKYRPQSLLAMLDAANLQPAEDFAFVGADAGAGVAASSKREDVGYSTAYDRGNSLDISDSSRLRNSSGLVSASAGAGSAVGAATGTATGAVIPFSALIANALKNTSSTVPASEEQPTVYYAKYPFEAKEFGELAFDAHTPIVVTDTSDNVWWMGYKDDGFDKPVSGLFPSNYVSKAKPF